jgi:signal peptidase
MKMKRVLSAIILFLFMAPFLAFAAGSYLPYFDGFTVVSGSMEPEIQTGSVLFTYKASPESISVGDTITFRNGDGFTTHEVISKNNSNGEIAFRTQGIANTSPDPWEVTEDEIKGKKLISIPLLGYFIVWAGTTEGLIFLILFPGTLLLLSETKSIVNEIRRDRK